MGSKADGNFVEASLDSLSQLLPERRKKLGQMQVCLWTILPPKQEVGLWLACSQAEASGLDEGLFKGEKSSEHSWQVFLHNPKPVCGGG